ncbi:serine protease [Sicyoidochytrium minutum DNA virus]|nr:serine protease [Sicyoidochytrium minutum DNA virus]
MAGANTELKIIGGNTLKTNAYPNVGVLKITDSGGLSLCTATLVHPNFAVTAAHCVVGDVQRVELFLGSQIASEQKRYRAKSWVLHPNYLNASRGNSGVNGSDIAIIELVNTVEGIPTMIVNDVFPDSETTDYQFKLLGYGFTSPTGPVSGTLKESLENTVGPLRCPVNNVPDNTLCLVRGNGIACNGDSGGPNTRFDVLFAVTSGGTCTQEPPNKQSNISATIYENLDFFQKYVPSDGVNYLSAPENTELRDKMFTKLKWWEILLIVLGSLFGLLLIFILIRRRNDILLRFRRPRDSNDDWNDYDEVEDDAEIGPADRRIRTYGKNGRMGLMEDSNGNRYIIDDKTGETYDNPEALVELSKKTIV